MQPHYIYLQCYFKIPWHRLAPVLIFALQGEKKSEVETKESNLAFVCRERASVGEENFTSQATVESIQSER